jgi:hypothetical protein
MKPPPDFHSRAGLTPLQPAFPVCEIRLFVSIEGVTCRVVLQVGINGSRPRCQQCGKIRRSRHPHSVGGDPDHGVITNVGVAVVKQARQRRQRRSSRLKAVRRVRTCEDAASAGSRAASCPDCTSSMLIVRNSSARSAVSSAASDESNSTASASSGVTALPEAKETRCRETPLSFRKWNDLCLRLT